MTASSFPKLDCPGGMTDTTGADQAFEAACPVLESVGTPKPPQDNSLNMLCMRDTGLL